MTLQDEAKQIRNEVAKLRSDKRRRYPAELRQRMQDWVERAAAAGQRQSECSRALGVRTWRFTAWRKEDARATKPTPLALVPIEVETRGRAVSVGLSLVSPSGYRIEGLSLEQVALLLREVL